MNRRKRQNQILQAALKVFFNLGYKAATVGDLVTAANVSRGTFYLYFKNKKEVMDFLIDSFSEEFLAALVCWRLSQFSPGDGLDHLQHEGFIVRLADCLKKYHLLGRMVFCRKDDLEKSHTETIALFETLVLHTIQTEIGRVHRVGLIKNIDAVVMSQCLWGALKEVALVQTYVADDSKQSLTHLFEMLFTGLMVEFDQSLIMQHPKDDFSPLYKEQSLY